MTLVTLPHALQYEASFVRALILYDMPSFKQLWSRLDAEFIGVLSWSKLIT